MGRIIYRCTDRGACGSGILDGTLYAINEYAIGYYDGQGNRKKVFVPYHLVNQDFDIDIMDYSGEIILNKEYTTLVDFEKYFDYFKPICDLEEYEPVEYNDLVKYNDEDYVCLHLSGNDTEYYFKKIGSKYSILETLNDIKNRIMYNIDLDDEILIEDAIELLKPIAEENFTVLIDVYDILEYSKEDREEISIIAKKQIQFLEKVLELSHTRHSLDNSIESAISNLESKYK